MSLLGAVEESYKRNITDFDVGDTVRVSVKVVEGDKERLQPFEGIVIARKGGGTRETFMVRKVSFGIGVERIFPLHSPVIDKVEVLKKGHVRRAKLYYLRGKKGKAAKVKEREKEQGWTSTNTTTS
jgi:large subunit ribosomal protein L19